MNQTSKGKLEADTINIKSQGETINIKSHGEAPTASYKFSSSEMSLSDDLVKQILLNPELQTLIFHSVEKHESNLKEKLTSEIR